MANYMDFEWVLIRARDQHLHSRLTARSCCCTHSHQNETNTYRDRERKKIKTLTGRFLFGLDGTALHILYSTEMLFASPMDAIPFERASECVCVLRATKVRRSRGNEIHYETVCSFTCPNIQLRIWNAIKWFYRVLYVFHSTQSLPNALRSKAWFDLTNKKTIARIINCFSISPKWF